MRLLRLLGGNRRTCGEQHAGNRCAGDDESARDRSHCCSPLKGRRESMTWTRGFTSAALIGMALCALSGRVPAAEAEKPPNASAWPSPPDPATLPPGPWKD